MRFVVSKDGETSATHVNVTRSKTISLEIVYVDEGDLRESVESLQQLIDEYGELTLAVRGIVANVQKQYIVQKLTLYNFSLTGKSSSFGFRPSVLKQILKLVKPKLEIIAFKGCKLDHYVLPLLRKFPNLHKMRVCLFKLYLIL